MALGKRVAAGRAGRFTSYFPHVFLPADLSELVIAK